ncbi:MAG: hypothetical protein U5M72_04150 [Pseudomonas sp.]|nr:hypothetical protein [Pseudomonas sp.]
MLSARSLAPSGSQTLKLKNLTITEHPPYTHKADELLEAVLAHLKEREKSNRSRLSAPICANGKTFFVKSTRLTSLPSRARATFNLKRQNGLYDWPIAELHNNIIINKITDQAPALIGHAIRTGRTGLSKDVVLIFECLDKHIDGLLWIKKNPSRINEFVDSMLELIILLNNQGIVHLDLWARNVMLPEDSISPIKLIDLENCPIGHTRYPSETLGFQFGFLFHHTLKKYIDEKNYDSIIENKISALNWLNLEKFSQKYEHFKHAHACRKKRQLITQKGNF